MAKLEQNLGKSGESQLVSEQGSGQSQEQGRKKSLDMGKGTPMNPTPTRYQSKSYRSPDLVKQSASSDFTKQSVSSSDWIIAGSISLQYEYYKNPNLMSVLMYG